MQTAAGQPLKVALGMKCLPHGGWIRGDVSVAYTWEWHRLASNQKCLNRTAHLAQTSQRGRWTCYKIVGKYSRRIIVMHCNAWNGTRSLPTFSHKSCSQRPAVWEIPNHLTFFMPLTCCSLLRHEMRTDSLLILATWRQLPNSVLKCISDLIFQRAGYKGHLSAEF